jgi:hypothetical protein
LVPVLALSKDVLDFLSVILSSVFWVTCVFFVAFFFEVFFFFFVAADRVSVFATPLLTTGVAKVGRLVAARKPSAIATAVSLRIVLRPHSVCLHCNGRWRRSNVESAWYFPHRSFGQTGGLTRAINTE